MAKKTRAEKREGKKKPKIKVSGKSVFEIKKLIEREPKRLGSKKPKA